MPYAAKEKGHQLITIVHADTGVGNDDYTLDQPVARGGQIVRQMEREQLLSLFTGLFVCLFPLLRIRRLPIGAASSDRQLETKRCETQSVISRSAGK
jgi:hypothetical protein